MSVEFHQRLRQLREHVGLTQKEAAEAAGVSISTYKAWEWADRSPDIEQLQKLARAFSMDLAGLVFENEAPALVWLKGLDGGRAVAVPAGILPPDPARSLRALFVRGRGPTGHALAVIDTALEEGGDGVIAVRDGDEWVIGTVDAEGNFRRRGGTLASRLGSDVDRWPVVASFEWIGP